MTKTIKKGLIAFLVAFMAVLVGVTASAWGNVKADETFDPKIAADNFINYVGQFENVELDDSLWNADGTVEGAPDQKTNKDLWEAYYKAKIGYPDIQGLSEELYSGLAEAKVKFTSIDAFFNEAYSYVSVIVNKMQDIAKNAKVNYKESREATDKLGAQLKLADVPEVDETVKDAWVPFIKSLTNDYEYYYRAVAFLDEIANKFSEIEEKINNISYYDTSTKEMKTRNDLGEGSDKYYIVLDSEDSVIEAEKLLKKYKEDGVDIEYAVDDVAVLVPGVDPNIKGPHTVRGVILNIDDIKLYVENYDEVDAARAVIDAYKEMAKEVAEKIHEVYDKVSHTGETTKYYTYEFDIEKCKKMYDDLNDYATYVNNTDNGEENIEKFKQEYCFDPEPIEDELPHLAAISSDDSENYNDLQKLVDTMTLGDCDQVAHAKKTAGMTGGEDTVNGALFEMLKYLKAQKDNIKATENALEELSKVEAKYDHTYLAAIQAVEENLKGISSSNPLYNDITKWDLDLYYEKNLDAVPPEDYAPDPNAYGDQFSQYGVKSDEEWTGKNYIVKGYEGFMKAKAQWQKWEDEIDKAIKMLQQLVEHYENNGDGHPMIRDEYASVFGFYNSLTKEQQAAFNYATKPNATTDNNDDEDRLIEVTENFAQGDEETHLKENDNNKPKDVMDEFARILNKIFDEVKDIIKNIDELNAEVKKAGCVFGQREVLIPLYKEYDALTVEEKAYVSNGNLLLEMWEEYQTELKLALAWKEEALKLEAYSDPEGITITAWSDDIDIEKVLSLFLDMLHDGSPEENREELKEAICEKLRTVEADEVAEALKEVLGKLQKAVAEDDAEEFENPDGNDDFLTFKDVYEMFIEYAGEYERLLKAIEDLDAAMDKLDATGELELDKVSEWNDEIKQVEEDFKALENKGVNEEWMSNEKNGHQDAWNNYQEAKKWQPKYNVEELINNIYDKENFWEKGKVPDGHSETGYTTDLEELIEHPWIDLTDDCLNKINEAEEALNKYLSEEGRSEEDIRNLSKLEAAQAALEKLTEDLNNWIRKVIKLDYAKYSADEVDNADKAKLDEWLNDIKENFKGYPLNIYDNEIVNPEGDESMRLADVYAAYTEIIGEGADATVREEYLKNAYETLQHMDELGNKDKDGVEENIINKLNKMIEEIVNKLGDESKGLEDEDLDKIEYILKTYNELHISQQVEIEEEGLEKVKEADDTRKAVEAFEGMLKELYDNVVVDGEVTNYSRFYLDTVISVFDTFSQSLKSTFSFDAKDEKPVKYDEAIAAIDEKIKQAEHDGTVLSLKALKEALEAAETGSSSAIQEAIEKLEEELKKAFTDAISSISDDDESGLKAAIAQFKENFKTEIEQMIDQKIEDAVAQLEEKLNSAKQELEEKFGSETKALNDAITGMQQQLKNLEAADKELQQKIEVAIKENNDARVKELQDQKAQLEGKLAELESKLTSQKSELEGQISQLKTELIAAIANGDTELEAKLNAEISELKGKVAACEENLNKAKQELNTKIEEVNKNLQMAIDACKDEVLKELNKLATELKGEISKLKEELSGAIEAYEDRIDALEQFKEATEKALSENVKKGDLPAFDSTLNSALAALDSKFAAKNEIDALRDEFEAKLLETSSSLSEIDALRAEMQNADKELQTQIDSMKSTVTTLTALIIVIGVLLVAAVACVVILFLKRK